MEADKSSPNSFQPPSPPPSWEQDQALSGHLVGAEATSVGPQPATEEDEASLLTEEGSMEEIPAGEGEDWDYDSQTEPSQECQGEAEEELSQEELGSSQDLSDWEDCNEPELCDGEFSECTSSMEGDNSSSDSVSIFTFGVTPSLLEEDSWHKVSLLQLYEDGGRAQSLPDGLPVPVPREAWLEGQPSESLPSASSLSSLHSQDSVAQQGPQAGPQSPGPALHSPSALRPGAQAPRQAPALFRKWPGRLRRALRALFRCPCLAPRPQD